MSGPRMSDSCDNASTYWIELLLDSRWVHMENPWILATLCSGLVGLSGLFPLLVLSQAVVGNEGRLVTKENSRLKFILSFAVGGLLGDVFLHLLPEAHERFLESNGGAVKSYTPLGLWILAGMLTFIIVEIIFNIDKNKTKDLKTDIDVSGYLNLIANCIDNFSHGLAVGGAFLISTKVGFITTLCILVHEIPHEIGDFAILMNAGFSRLDAAKAQLSTASIGIFGALFALALDSLVSVEAYTSWIIPFTCGGFINIAMVTVLPDLLESDNVKDCVQTLVGVSSGMLVMMAVTSF